MTPTVIQDKEFFLDLINNMSILNSGITPANALDEAKENSDFSQKYNKLIDELHIDQQIINVEETTRDMLDQIKHLTRTLIYMKNHAEFDVYSQRLMQLMHEFIQKIKRTKSKTIKADLFELFKNVDSTLFKNHIALINEELRNF